ncbi:MAG: hypothetical protein [Arizlama microvirus]|nr:MAG: hypothetical protein [Arizlama microvirus]
MGFGETRRVSPIKTKNYYENKNNIHTFAPIFRGAKRG